MIDGIDDIAADENSSTVQGFVADCYIAHFALNSGIGNQYIDGAPNDDADENSFYDNTTCGIYPGPGGTLPTLTATDLSDLLNGPGYVPPIPRSTMAHARGAHWRCSTTSP